MTCSFCFNDNIGKTDDMAVQDFKKMAGTVARAGVREIDILGGEPTLHGNIVEMVSIASNQGLKVSLSSNGSNMPVARKLVKAFGDDCILGISVNQGRVNREIGEFLAECRPVVKALYRGKGCFRQQIRSILRRTHGKFYLIYPDIIAGNRADSLPFGEFRERVFHTKRMIPDVEPVYCSGFLPDSALYPELSETRCPAGVTKLGILPDGSVFPCNLFFGMKEFCIGNILTDSFGTIWNSQKLRFFRRFRENHCPVAGCELHESCHGGCPAHSMKFYGKLDGPDPRCAEQRTQSKVGSLIRTQKGSPPIL